MNKILKDFVVKSRTMMGFDAPYVPGYDCHGLPIELKVDRELGPKKRDMPVADFRRACRDYATRFIDVMNVEFQRLGVFGDWDDLYLTMDFRYQAAIARALGKFVERGLVYKGKKPVHWCIHCRTALAEAEVEYSDHSSPSIYVEFPVVAESADRLGDVIPALAGRPLSVLIWTTTPWTIPSNLAIAFHPDFDYAAYDVDGRAVIVAEALRRRSRRRRGRTFGAPIARMKGEQLEHVRFQHPLYARESVGVLADYVTLEQGTGAVHTAPGHGSDDFMTGMKYGLEIYAPGRPGRAFPRDGGAVRRPAGVRRQPAESRRRCTSAGGCGTAQTFQHYVSALLALQKPGDLSSHAAVVHRDGRAVRRQPAADPRHAAHRPGSNAIDTRSEWVPAWGHDRIYKMVANRPDWCISRQRAWGVPIPAVDCTECGEALLTPAARRHAPPAVFDVRRRRLVRRADRGLPSRRSRSARRAAAPGSSASATSSTCGSIGLEPRRGAPVRAGAGAGRPTSISRAATSIAAGSRLAPGRPRHAEQAAVHARS